MGRSILIEEFVDDLILLSGSVDADEFVETGKAGHVGGGLVDWHLNQQFLGLLVAFKICHILLMWVFYRMRA